VPRRSGSKIETDRDPDDKDDVETHDPTKVPEAPHAGRAMAPPPDDAEDDDA
jgi:hypothetical protein